MQWLSPLQKFLQWRNGEKTGIESENGEIEKSGARRGRAISFPFSPAPARFILISSLPIPQPTGKTKETSEGERVAMVRALVSHQCGLV